MHPKSFVSNFWGAVHPAGRVDFYSKCYLSIAAALLLVDECE